MNYPIPWLTLVILATIRSIGYHLLTTGKQLVGIIGIGGVPNAFLVNSSKAGIGYLMPSVPDPNLQIEPYHHRQPSVTECPRLK
jgi:hypothetical protein